MAVAFFFNKIILLYTCKPEVLAITQMAILCHSASSIGPKSIKKLYMELLLKPSLKGEFSVSLWEKNSKYDSLS